MSRTRFVINLFVLCIFLGARTFAGSLPIVDPEKLDQLDSIEGLAAQLGEDRLIKYLVRSGDPNAPAEKVSRALVDEVIAQSLADGTALTEMGRSLQMGDHLLKKAISEQLKAISFDDLQISQILKAWGTGKPPDSLSKILLSASQQEKTFAPLVEYLLNTRNMWPRVCNNVMNVLRNEELLSPEMLRTSITIQDLIPSSSVDTIMVAAKAGDFDSRMRLMQSVHQLLDRSGTVASYLGTAGEQPTSWYQSMWSRVINRVAGNPVLLYNYVKRLRESSFLYDEWRLCTIKALTQDDCDFFDNYYKAAEIHGSRFDVALKEILPQDRETEVLGAASARSKELRKGMVERMKESSKWTDNILWQLTRPAESFSATLRASLPVVLESNPDVSLSIIEFTSGQFQTDFSKLLAKTPAFSFYGSIDAFRVKAASKQLTPEALKTFGFNCGKLLAYNDVAWDQFFKESKTEHNNTGLIARRGVVTEAIKADKATVEALIRTLQTNDSRLSGDFAKWLVTTKRSTAISTYEKWLDELVRQLDNSEVTGNTDVANFKTWMVEFIKTEPGWRDMEARINIESCNINSALRESLVKWLVKNESELWKLLRATAVTEGLTNVTLIPRLRNFVVTSKLNEYLLREITAQNQVAIQSVYLVWPQLLGSTAPTTNAIIEAFLKGEVLNDVYPVFATAMVAVLQDDTFGVPFHGQMASALGMPESTDHETVVAAAVQQITTRGGRAKDLISNVMTDGTMREAWRKQFLNEVRIMGRAHVVTSFILRREELQREWATELADSLTKDPALLEKIINALGSRKLGDRAWVSELDSARKEVARILVEDRIMFEQIIANKTSLFGDAFTPQVVDIFGLEIAREWIPEISNK